MYARVEISGWVMIKFYAKCILIRCWEGALLPLKLQAEDIYYVICSRVIIKEASESAQAASSTEKTMCIYAYNYPCTHLHSLTHSDSHHSQVCSWLIWRRRVCSLIILKAFTASKPRLLHLSAGPQLHKLNTRWRKREREAATKKEARPGIRKCRLSALKLLSPRLRGNKGRWRVSIWWD